MTNHAPMTTPTRGRGRPKKLGSVVTISVDRGDVEAAEQLVPVLDRVSTVGMRHNRTDVLRAAIKRGLASLHQELNVQPMADGDRLIETTPLVRAAVDRALRRTRAQ